MSLFSDSSERLDRPRAEQEQDEATHLLTANIGSCGDRSDNLVGTYPRYQKPFSYELHGCKIEDPYQWLEEVQGKDASSFVEEQNRKTLGRFQGKVFNELKATFTRLNAPDDLELPIFGSKYVIKHQDGPDSPKGKILIAPREDFLRDKEKTKYATLLDIDLLAEQEGVDWFYAGASHKPGIGDRMLVYLSKAGADATVIREFDLKRKVFLDEGLDLGEGEARALYFGKTNSIVFTIPSSPENTSDSGYPLEVKFWDRKSPISKARSLYIAPRDHMSVDLETWTVQKNDIRVVVYDNQNYYESEILILSQDKNTYTKLPLPKRRSILELNGGILLFVPRESYQLGEDDYQGGVVAFDISKFLKGGQRFFQGVFKVNPSQSVESAFIHKGRIFLQYSENVVSKICKSNFSIQNLKTGWVSRPEFQEILLPGKGSIHSFGYIKKTGILVGYTDFVTPTSYYLINSSSKSLGAPFLQKPFKFNSENIKVSQEWAISADGTRIPFFVLDGRSDRSIPSQTILYGYGGFNYTEMPHYPWLTGSAWIEKGGIYVVSNLRGGGEFGPAWHQAAIKADRVKAYQDCAAVAERLFELRFTTPSQLGMIGRSNGGLLVGNMLTMYPQYFRAAVSIVPLLDMLRYDQLLKGSAWVAEYGSPKIKEEFEWLKKISAYHNLDSNKKYPAVLFTTSTADDRVHPCHARKMAAKMQDLNIPDVYLYEKTDGGHNSSDFAGWITEATLIYTFFHQMLNTSCSERAES